MKKYSPLLKVSVLILLTLIMIIPVTMVMNIIDERNDYQRMVIHDITKSVGGEQVVAGPILVQPYIRDNILRHKYFLPEQLDIKGDLNVENRKLGIYQAQIYKGDIAVKGQFSGLNVGDILTDNTTLQTPYLVVTVKNAKGIINLSTLSLQQENAVEIGNNKTNQWDLVFDAGVSASAFKQGVHAMLPADILRGQEPIEFSFSLALQGGQRFSVVPLGRNTTYSLAANWPHPNFLGESLPVEKTITDAGFTATWKSSWFANNINDKFSRCNYSEYSDDNQCKTIHISELTRFDSTLIELVDEYQLTERSVKYAILFISLTFISFFLFEVMKGLCIHPIQYLLVGTALVMFYLVLLALSEYIGFNLAYLAAALTCSGLITFYLCAVLKSVKRGLVFGGGLLVLYTILLGLLQLDNIALLLGTLLLFVVLATVMILTRHLDWYNIAVKPGGGVTESDDSIDKEFNEKIDRKRCRLWK